MCVVGYHLLVISPSADVDYEVEFTCTGVPVVCK